MRSRDTDEDAEQVQLELLRNATTTQRAALALSLTRTTLELAWRAAAKAHPTTDPDEAAVFFVAAVYGSDLAAELRDELARRRASRA